jgi:hypothetical protein
VCAGTAVGESACATDTSFATCTPDTRDRWHRITIDEKKVLKNVSAEQL